MRCHNHTHMRCHNHALAATMRLLPRMQMLLR